MNDIRLLWPLIIIIINIAYIFIDITWRIINIIKAVDGTVDKVPESGDTNTFVNASIEAYPGNQKNNKLEDSDYILPLSEDVIKSGRLYTVSVTLTEKDNDSNVIRFTGAKEAN